MRFIAKKTREIMEKIRGKKYKEMAKMTEKAFERKRKLPLEALIMSLLKRRGMTLKMEIKELVEAGIMQEKISTTGYSKQRQKLNPEAIGYLYKTYNKELYENGEMSEYKGYVLLAADGSSMNVPTTEETLKKYGTSSRKGTKPQAEMLLNCLHDVINKTILTINCENGKSNEAKQAEKHVAELPDLIGDKKSIIVEDRGYPSLGHMAKYEQMGQKFVIRLKSKDFKAERECMKSDDEEVQIAATRSRLNNYRDAEEREMLEKMGGLRVRVVNVALPNGGKESLVTNLSACEFSGADIAWIYKQRWEIETAFEVLKNKLECENFTGILPLLIEQDIQASVFVFDLAMHAIADAEQLREKEKVPQTKHKMAVNRNFAIGLLKRILIEILTSQADDQELLIADLIDEIKSEVLPVRPGRRFVRTKGVLAGNFSNSHKRPF